VSLADEVALSGDAESADNHVVDDCVLFEGWRRESRKAEMKMAWRDSTVTL
jgi:hypothetical protein